MSIRTVRFFSFFVERSTSFMKNFIIQIKRQILTYAPSCGIIFIEHIKSHIVTNFYIFLCTENLYEKI